METFHLISLRSSISSDSHLLDREKELFLQELTKRFGVTFSDEKKEGQKNLFLIETGGTEEAFLATYKNYPAPYYLLTTKIRNSLPAALEIAAYLSQEKLDYKILHGDLETLGEQFKEIQNHHASLSKDLIRLGVVGNPSSWLIASRVDRLSAQEKYGIEFKDITYEEFNSEINAKQYELSEKVRKIAAINANNPYLEGSLHIFGALKRLVKKYHLDGFSIRCFDLLSSYKNTSCLALALLNDEGISAGCEGDLPILVGMNLVQKYLHLSSFQANPSNINVEKKQIVFAHCTVPMDMCSNVAFFTHFESDLGIGIRGELPLGPCSIFRFSGNLKKAILEEGEIVANTTRDDLCRTQIVVHVKNGVQKFLDYPLGNHQLIILGHHKKTLTKILLDHDPTLELV